MAHIFNRAIYILDADTAPTFNPGAEGGHVAAVKGTSIVYFHTSDTSWTRVNIGSLAGADGNHVPIARGDAIENIAPTSGEIPSPASGDSASVYLTSGKLEYWVYTTVWTKAYVLQADLASNLAVGTVTSTTVPITNSNGTGFTIPQATTSLAGLLNSTDKTKLSFISITQAVDLDAMETDVADLTTLTGVASNAVNLGTFTGTTIADNVTIKAALQALETALETYIIKTASDTNSIDMVLTGTDLTANVKLHGTQDNEFAVTIAANGLKLTKQTLTVFASRSLAQASGLAVGDAYFLSAANEEGIIALGAAGPKFFKV